MTLKNEFFQQLGLISVKRKDLMDTKASLPSKVRVQHCSTSTSSDSSSKSFSLGTKQLLA